MPTLQSVVVVGASLAGLNAAEALRRQGYTGRLTIVGAEPHRPYDRPPLSKEVLRGEWAPERTALRQGPDLDALGAEWRLGVRATGLDVDGRVLDTDTGEVPYDGLVIATGAAPRRLPGMPETAFVLRTLDDAVALAAAFDAASSVAVVGAGFIGLEVAAAARTRGLDVTVYEVAEVPLALAVGPEVGGAIAALHRQRGVDLRLGTAVDWATLDADVVVVGIGVAPETGWLEGSGLSLDNGVVCDETCTAAPGVVAAGDVCRWPNRLFGETMRVEHWDHAVQQGMAAARSLLGAAEPFEPVPYFWSDQYDVKVQMVGRSSAEVVPLVGEPGDEKWAVAYLRDGVVVGALTVKSPRVLMKARLALPERPSLDDLRLALGA